MAANDGDTRVPIRVEVAQESDGDFATRIPGAAAAAAIAPGAALAYFPADDDAPSVYADPAALRAGDSAQTYAGVAEPGPEMNHAGSFDAGAADGGGE